MPTMPKQKPGRSKQDYGTPWELIERTKELVGISEFDCDLAATLANRKCPQFFGPPGYEVPSHYRGYLGADALANNWRQGTGWNWLNPPFARIGPWVEKAWWEWVRHDARTAVLVPAGVGANWWRDWVHRKAQVLLLNGRIIFEGETLPYVKDCALLLYGQAPEYQVWNWKLGRRGVY